MKKSLRNSKIVLGKIFYFFLFFYLTGIFIGNFYQFNYYFNIFLISLALAFFVSNYKNKKNILVLFIILGVVLGNFRISREKNFIAKLNNEKKEFDGAGLIIEEPKAKKDYQELVVCPFLKEKNKKENCKKRFLAFVPKYKKVDFGDLIKIKCNLEIPENRGDNFNYQNYLANKKIYYICKNVEIEQGNPKEKVRLSSATKVKVEIFKKTQKIRLLLEGKINTLFFQPQSGYLAGLLLGGEDRLPEKVAENFRKTGTTHTVAVSGFNITIIAEFLILFSIAIGFWRKQAFLVALFGILFFVIMIGAPSSALRAAIMGGILLWGSAVGRLSRSYFAAIFAGAVMLTFSPLSLFYDAGFQLSFLATLGIIFVYVPLSKKIKIKNDFLELKSLFLVTISAQLGVFGIIIYNFELFSLSSLLVNMIILPLIPAIMLFGFIAVLTSFLSLFLAKIISLPVSLLLLFEISIVNFFAKFDLFLIEFKDVSKYWLAGYYLFLVMFIFYLNKKRSC